MRFGQVAKSIQKAAHRGLGGDATALGAADSVGDRRHHVAARFGQLRAENGAGEILVAFTRPGLGAKPTLALTPESAQPSPLLRFRVAAWIAAASCTESRLPDSSA